MARKRYSGEDVLRLLGDMEMLLADGNDVASACRSIGISDATSELQVAGVPIVMLKTSIVQY